MASTELRAAAQQALEALEADCGGRCNAEYNPCWQREVAETLRAALVEDAMQKFTDVNQELQAALGCDHCNQPLYAAVKCRVCGRVTSAEPVQEPVAWSHINGTSDTKWHPPQRPAEPVQEPIWVCPDSAEHRYGKPGHCEDCGKTLVQVAEPVQEQPVCDECGKNKCDGWALYCVGCVEPMFAPPQRKPLTLTDEIIADLWHQNGGFHHHFARAIERWLRGHA